MYNFPFYFLVSLHVIPLSYSLVGGFFICCGNVCALMYYIRCVSGCVKYKGRGSEGSPFRDMLSLGAGRIGLGCLGKHAPDVVAAAVKHTNFIIHNEIIYYFVCAGD